MVTPCPATEDKFSRTIYSLFKTLPRFWRLSFKFLVRKCCAIGSSSPTNEAMNQHFTGLRCCHGECPVLTELQTPLFPFAEDFLHKNLNSTSRTNRVGEVRTLKITRCGGSAIPRRRLRMTLLTYLLT